MRVAANNDHLLQKKKVSAGVVHVQSEQGKHTTSGPMFKRKRLEAAPPSEHSHSDGRALDQHVLTIQECEVVESSKGKCLWDPNFDISAHGESCFLLDKDRARLMAHDEDHLFLDS